MTDTTVDERPGQMTRSDRSSTYWPQLDGLRALAVLSVLVHHFIPRGAFLNQVLPFGELGVRLFFVLSGFLITGILLRSRDRIDRQGYGLGRELKRFYIRRSFRIFPIYYLTLIGASLIGMKIVRDSLPWTLTYLANFYVIVEQSWLGPIAHLWSLATEEQFYLIWPWVVFMLGRRLLLPTMLAVSLLGTLTALYGAATGQGPIWQIAFPILSLDSLGWGAVLAYCLHQPQPLLTSFRRWLWLAGPVLLAVILVFGDNRWATSIQATLMSLFFVWVVERAVTSRVGLQERMLAARPLVYLGKISYGIYLFHNFVPYILQPILHRLYPAQFGPTSRPSTGFPPLDFVLLTGISLLVAMLSWHLIESPIARLKDRLTAELPPKR